MLNDSRLYFHCFQSTNQEDSESPVKSDASTEDEDSQDESFTCELCKDSFSTLKSYDRHTKTAEHKQKLRKVARKCKMCDIDREKMTDIFEFHPCYKALIDEPYANRQSGVICQRCARYMETMLELRDLKGKYKEVNKSLSEEKQVSAKLSQKLKQNASQHEKDAQKHVQDYDLALSNIYLSKFKVRIEELDTNQLNSEDLKRFKEWKKRRQEPRTYADLVDEVEALKTEKVSIKADVEAKLKAKDEELKKLREDINNQVKAILKSKEANANFNYFSNISMLRNCPKSTPSTKS